MEPRWSSMGLAASIGERGRALDGLGRHRLALERPLGRGGAHRRRGHRGQRDARLGAAAVGHRELRGHADDRDVELAPRRVPQVLAAAVGARRRHDQLDQQLVRREHRLADPGEEVGHRHAPLAARPRDDRLRPRAPPAAAPCRPTARRCRGCRPRWPGCGPGASRPWPRSPRSRDRRPRTRGSARARARSPRRRCGGRCRSGPARTRAIPERSTTTAGLSTPFFIWGRRSVPPATSLACAPRSARIFRQSSRLFGRARSNRRISVSWGLGARSP